jgi:hypothetical protein
MDSSDHRNCITSNRLCNDKLSINEKKMSPLAKKSKEKEEDEKFENKSLVKAMYDDVMK